MTDYMCPADPTVTHCYHAAKVNEIICAHTDTIAALTAEVEDYKSWAAQVTVEANEEVSRLTARVEELEGVLDDIVQWADRHGKDPDWLEAARAALTQETRDE